MDTRSSARAFVAGSVAAVVIGAAVTGVGVAELESAARSVGPRVEQAGGPGSRPSFVETLVVVGRRPGVPRPALPQQLVVSLSLGTDGSVSQVQAVSAAGDRESLDALDTWLASQRYAPAVERRAR